ncbi:thermonuclease family protein [Methylobacterium durans]|uniref:Nuclease n=1 Tax=Methylobacterium durans TaxID=2202825 RepID=A0A2U8WC33_9HYPH|nr:thermonuclease family protein [Methylobacterium durans]AWN43687.1 nuclease [Methylobacterium durans]
MLRTPLAVLILSGALSPALAAESGAGHPISGRATVIDGDTIEVRGTRIRLYGIDAPEAAQTCETSAGRSYKCGREAAHALAERIGTGIVTCEPHREASGRRAAICRLGHEDLSAWMAAQGHAVADRRQSTSYAGAESKAWATRRGLWAGTFEEPAEWRRASRSAEAAAGSALAE